MSSEFSSVLIWYLFVVGVGWATFPISYALFRTFPDRGAAFAKTQGLFLLAYLIWILTSLGVMPYRRPALMIVLGLYLIGSLIAAFMHGRRLLRFLRTRFTHLLLLEGVFLLFFLVCVIVRMYNPDITGAEKEPDFTFLNAILHSQTFPPKDTWFAGETINYYYFGYVIWANLISYTGVISPVGFNLALATIVALAAVGIFGVVYRFTRRLSYSAFSSLLLCVFGNLDGLIQLIERYGNPLPYDWWRSSRVIPDTINEFPFFSFLLGDLHPHFMSIPFLLLLIALLSELADALAAKTSLKRTGLLVGCLSLSLGGAAMLNSWDYPTFFILTALCIALQMLAADRSDRPLLRQVVLIIAFVVGIGGLSYGFFLPFHRHFITQVGLKNLQAVSPLQRSNLWYFLVIYGWFVWVALSFLGEKAFDPVLEQWRRMNLSKNARLVLLNSAILIPFLMYAGFADMVMISAFLLSAVFLWLTYREFQHGSAARFPFLLIFLAFAILFGCEVVYIKDFYAHPLERQNTIFKFYYQAWILLSVGVVYLLFLFAQKLRQRPRSIAYGWRIVFIVLCAACAIFPAAATYEKTNYFRSGARGGLLYIPTLNGVSYIAYVNPYEYEAMLWVQGQTDENSVILEATGKPYSFFGRVAATTGRSTVLGWGNHEALWRDQTWQRIGQRTDDIKKMYATVNKAEILPLVQQYRLDYIYVGTLERETYAAEGLTAFDGVFPMVFENSSVKIYRVSRSAP